MSSTLPEIEVETDDLDDRAKVQIRRGCGRRLRGGIYVEVDSKSDDSDGSPTPGADRVADNFERCLLDPPIPVDIARMGLSAIGVTLVEAVASDGRRVTHVFDIIGQSHYPNVASFIDEARAKGVSRRLARTLDFSRLEAGRSRLVLVHARGWLDNAAEYFAARTSTRWPCPKLNYAHLDRDNPPLMCSSLFWEDLEAPGDPSGERHVTVTCGDTVTTGLRTPEGVRRASRHAIIGSFPITRLAVIADPLGSTHEMAARSASRSSIDVEIVPA